MTTSANAPQVKITHCTNDLINNTNNSVKNSCCQNGSIVVACGLQEWPALQLDVVTYFAEDTASKFCVSGCSSKVPCHREGKRKEKLCATDPSKATWYVTFSHTSQGTAFSY